MNVLELSFFVCVALNVYYTYIDLYQAFAEVFIRKCLKDSSGKVYGLSCDGPNQHPGVQQFFRFTAFSKP